MRVQGIVVKNAAKYSAKYHPALACCPHNHFKGPRGRRHQSHHQEEGFAGTVTVASESTSLSIPLLTYEEGKPAVP